MSPIGWCHRVVTSTTAAISATTRKKAITGNMPARWYVCTVTKNRATASCPTHARPAQFITKVSSQNNLNSFINKFIPRVLSKLFKIYLNRQIFNSDISPLWNHSGQERGPWEDTTISKGNHSAVAANSKVRLSRNSFVHCNFHLGTCILPLVSWLHLRDRPPGRSSIDFISGYLYLCESAYDSPGLFQMLWWHMPWFLDWKFGWIERTNSCLWIISKFRTGNLGQHGSRSRTWNLRYERRSRTWNLGEHWSWHRTWYFASHRRLWTCGIDS